MVNKIITIGIVIVLVLVLVLVSQKSSFVPIPLNLNSKVIVTPEDVLPKPMEPFNVYQFDSRYQFPTMPPVNPMVSGSSVYDNIPVSPDLDPSIMGQQTNKLEYSGGSSKLIKIPLQYNVNDSQNLEYLRTQDVLVTPYNKIKYGSC